MVYMLICTVRIWVLQINLGIFKILPLTIGRKIYFPTHILIIKGHEHSHHTQNIIFLANLTSSLTKNHQNASYIRLSNSKRLLITKCYNIQQICWVLWHSLNFYLFIIICTLQSGEREKKNDKKKV
jgi:hypothetical protein